MYFIRMLLIEMCFLWWSDWNPVSLVFDLPVCFIINDNWSFMSRANCTWRDSAAWGRAKPWTSPLRNRPRGWSRSGSLDQTEQRAWVARGDPRVPRSDVQRLTGESGPVQSDPVRGQDARSRFVFEWWYGKQWGSWGCTSWEPLTWEVLDPGCGFAASSSRYYSVGCITVLEVFLHCFIVFGPLN